MMYFTKTYFNSDSEGQQMEVALRKFASKRHTSLDFQSSSTDIGTEKRFLGYEGKKDLKFTRLRTSFEKYLPKMIISLPKDTNQNYYKIRLSFLTTVVLGIFSACFVLTVALIIVGKITLGGFFAILMLYVVYLLLIYLELKLTNSRIEGVVGQRS